MPALVSTNDVCLLPTFPSSIAEKLAECGKEDNKPLWLGPSAEGWNGGVTQSMLQGYCGCRERFRVKYVLGLKPADRWEKSSGYGSMWHICEEALAGGNVWYDRLVQYTQQQFSKYPLQRGEIEKWYNVCAVQFPVYVDYWSQHPDVQDRQSLMAEQVFDVPYALPTGRVVRLRGKFDSVDLIPSQGGVLKQENKTKGEVDPVSIQRQMKFDLQTATYRVALDTMKELLQKECDVDLTPQEIALRDNPIVGTRYNVVLREVTIKPHAEKVKRGKHGRKTLPDEPDTVTPAETDEEFYERLRRDYYAANPDKYFFRLTCRVSAQDVATFRRQCLDPVLENLADDYEWWAWCLKKDADQWDSVLRSYVFPAHAQRHFRFPFGCYSSLTEGGFTDYDEFLESGVRSGLRRADKLFEELA